MTDIYAQLHSKFLKLNDAFLAEPYLALDKRIKLFINKENGGAGVARNNSIKEAKKIIKRLKSENKIRRAFAVPYTIY